MYQPLLLLTRTAFQLLLLLGAALGRQLSATRCLSGTCKWSNICYSCSPGEQYFNVFSH
jgi:hypothetical protein